MRIVLVNQYYSEKMGYADNGLAKALVSLGHDVHIVASVAQPYSHSPGYAAIYERFLGPAHTPVGETSVDGYRVHRLQLEHSVRGQMRLVGLARAMVRIAPDAVQTFSSWSLTTTQLALLQPVLRWTLMSSCHIHASVFPDATRALSPRTRLRWGTYKATIGRTVSRAIARCYAISTDAADIAHRFFGIQQSKIVVAPLGVDTSLFSPTLGGDTKNARARVDTRAKLGIADDEIVCIYTGRFSADKDPQCLARAIGMLRARGKRVRGLFVGAGDAAEAGALRGDGLTVFDFVDFRELPALYHAADIAVWPKQESTSQLDAMAVGLPLILSDRVHTKERLEGNGLTYKESDAESLAAAIERLSDVDTRRRMGDVGARRIVVHYAWTNIARGRVEDYRRGKRA